MPISDFRDRSVFLATLVAALGYFVDIFDLLLFGLVRKASLREILAPQLEALKVANAEMLSKLSESEYHDVLGRLEDKLLSDAGITLNNILQMTGLLVGGILWGILADRFGRMKMLFGSIIVYSIANLLNASIADIPASSPFAFLSIVGLDSAFNQYGVLRFLAGVGLAGELGAGITLVSELVSKERRGIATTLVASVGILGAVAAYFVQSHVGWRGAYLVGGLLGLGLLFLRIGVVESGMFDRLKETKDEVRGAVWMLLYPPKRLLRYLCVVMCAVPIWFCVGTLVYNADVIGRALGLSHEHKPEPNLSIMYCYAGLAAGDLLSGLLSQVLKSRKRALLAFQVLMVVAIALHVTVGSQSLTMYYATVTLIGFSAGYWAVFATTAAEQFGTNVRATAATSAPNFVRWSAGGSALLWAWLGPVFAGPLKLDAALAGAVVVSAILLPLAMLSLYGLRETFGTSLDWVEDSKGERRAGPERG